MQEPKFSGSLERGNGPVGWDDGRDDLEPPGSFARVHAGSSYLGLPGQGNTPLGLQSVRGTYEWSSAEFTGVEAVTFTANSSCTPEQVRAYDRLVKVEPFGQVVGPQGRGSEVLASLPYLFRRDRLPGCRSGGVCTSK